MWIANLNFIDFEKGYLQITKRQKELVREIRRMIEEAKDLSGVRSSGTGGRKI
jgi:hypothetical protein